MNARKTGTTSATIKHIANPIPNVPNNDLHSAGRTTWTNSQRWNVPATSALPSAISTPQVFTIKPNVSNLPSTPAVRKSNARINAKAKDTIKTQINLPNANP